MGTAFVFKDFAFVFSRSELSSGKFVLCYVYKSCSGIIVHFLSSILVYRVTERSDKPENNMWHWY